MMDLFISFLLLFVRIVGCGVWVGLRREMGFWERGARIAVFGVLLNILPALVLSAFGVWTPVVDFGVWGLVCILLGVCAFVRDRSCWRCAGVLWAALVVGGLLLVAVLLPVRSEWLVGGWDPGLYQTTAVEIVRNNGTQSFERDVYLRLTSEERMLFSNDENGYREVLPGVPISIEDGKLQHYFFPLTPIWGAFLFRLGGLPLLVRSGVLVAFLGLLPFGALLSWIGGWRLVAAGLAFLLVSPLWWYHQGVPTSELLQLLLLLGGCCVYLDVRLRRGSDDWLLFGLAFASAVNRFSDPPLVGIVLFFVAIGEVWCANRERFWQRAGFLFAGLSAGMLWVGAFYPLTLFRLEAKDAALTIVVVVFGVVFGLVLAAYYLVPRTWMVVLRRCLFWGCVGAGVVTVALVVPSIEVRVMRMLEDVPFVFWAVHRYTRLIAYHGLAFWLLSIVGMMLLFRSSDAEEQGRNIAAIFVVACLAITVLLILNPGIAPFYPWALRRYLVFLIPLLALCQGVALVWGCCFSRKNRYLMVARVMVLGLSVGAFVQGADISKDAIRAGDYVGMSDFIARLTQSFERGDIVVADDARWATPLLLVSGFDAVDGSLIWKQSDLAVRQVMIESILRVGKESGRRVVWVTSTNEGLGLYGDSLSGRSGMEVALPVPFSYETVIHSSRAQTYVNRDIVQTYRIWVLRD